MPGIKEGLASRGHSLLYSAARGQRDQEKCGSFITSVCLSGTVARWCLALGTSLISKFSLSGSGEGRRGGILFPGAELGLEPLNSGQIPDSAHSGS